MALASLFSPEAVPPVAAACIDHTLVSLTIIKHIPHYINYVMFYDNKSNRTLTSTIPDVVRVAVGVDEVVASLLGVLHLLLIALLLLLCCLLVYALVLQS